MAYAILSSLAQTAQQTQRRCLVAGWAGWIRNLLENVMTKFIVTLEKYGNERSKRVTVECMDNEYAEANAMALAQMKCRGWIPVDVCRA